MGTDQHTASSKALHRRSATATWLLLAWATASAPACTGDRGDDTGGGDDTGSDVPLEPLEACMAQSGLDFACAAPPRTETAVAGERVPCLAGSSPTAQVFLTFWLSENDPDGTVHLLELRLQDERWSTTNDGDRWVVTFDEPIALGSGDSLPATATGTAVLDTYTMTAPFAFLQGELDRVDIELTTPATLGQLASGVVLGGTITGSGGEFLVFDGVADSPDPLDDYDWISDPTAEAWACFHTTARIHPLDQGDP